MIVVPASAEVGAVTVPLVVALMFTLFFIITGKEFKKSILNWEKR